MTQNITNLPIHNKNQYSQTPAGPNFTSGGTPISSSGVVQNNPLLSRAEKAQDNTSTIIIGGGLSAAGLFALNNFINNPLQTKEYKDTFFQKVETYVDKQAAKHSSKPNVVKAKDFFSKINKGIKTRIDNSEILRTLFRKPSLGGPQVQSQAEGARGHLANRAVEVMKKYKVHHKATTGVEFTQFDTILKKAEKDSYKYYDEILRTIKGSSADLKQVISKKPAWGLGLVKNKASLQEILNKGTLINNYKLIGKTLGQKSAGYLMRATECLTNGMFSGKGQVLIQAAVIAQSFSEAAKAEKGEKFQTFMASLTELMAFFATMGIQMRVVNHLAGLKFMGMSKPNHAQYQKLMETVNNAAKAGDHTLYNTTKAQIKALKQSANANMKWYQKPIKWVGDLMSFGRLKETIKPLKASKAATNFAKIPYGLKVGVGYAGRAALVMAVIMPFFSNIGKKLSYAVFGKPVKTLEKEKAEAKAAEEASKAEELKQQQELQKQIEEYQKQQQAAQNPQAVQQPTQTAQPGDLINKMNQQTQPMGAQSMSESTPAASSLSSPDSKIKRNYIPNPVLGPENSVNASSSRTAQIDAAMRQADAAEAMAQKYM